MDVKANTSYSVLMSVYVKENPDNFRASIESILNQTIQTNDFVIICDGPLSDELNKILAFYQSEFGFIHVYRKPINQGLGLALQFGVPLCKNEIIMRMDSDDFSIPTRAEIQLKYMDDFDLVSSDIEEFEGSIDNIIGRRVVPKTYDKIVKFSKQRSPFNHPAVVYKKSVVLKAGNYEDCKLREDYMLWIKILKVTNKVCNISDILVKMRSGVEMRLRRSDKSGRKASKQILKYQRKIGNINYFEYMWIGFKHFVFYSSPLWLKKFYYKTLLRK